MHNRAPISASIVILDIEAAFFETVTTAFHAKQYPPLLIRWHEAIIPVIAQQPPGAIVISLSHLTPVAEHVISGLQRDPTLQHIPIIVCSDNATLLQDAVTVLRHRPGCVQASSCNTDELFAKLPAPTGEAHSA
jgi:hypothetical protein